MRDAFKRDPIGFVLLAGCLVFCVIGITLFLAWGNIPLLASGLFSMAVFLAYRKHI